MGHFWPTFLQSGPPFAQSIWQLFLPFLYPTPRPRSLFPASLLNFHASPPHSLLTPTSTSFPYQKLVKLATLTNPSVPQFPNIFAHLRPILPLSKPSAPPQSARLLVRKVLEQQGGNVQRQRGSSASHARPSEGQGKALWRICRGGPRGPPTGLRPTLSS